MRVVNYKKQHSQLVDILVDTVDNYKLIENLDEAKVQIQFILSMAGVKEAMWEGLYAENAEEFLEVIESTLDTFNYEFVQDTVILEYNQKTMLISKEDFKKLNNEYFDVLMEVIDNNPMDDISFLEFEGDIIMIE